MVLTHLVCCGGLLLSKRCGIPLLGQDADQSRDALFDAITGLNMRFMPCAPLLCTRASERSHQFIAASVMEIAQGGNR
jgi:hypothetical protein